MAGVFVVASWTVNCLDNVDSCVGILVVHGIIALTTPTQTHRTAHHARRAG